MGKTSCIRCQGFTLMTFAWLLGTTWSMSTLMTLGVLIVSSRLLELSIGSLES